MIRSDCPQSTAASGIQIDPSILGAVESSHRIANSLSLTVALLSMQRQQSEDEAVRKAILSAEARVASIAKVHAYLHKHGARDRVDLADYLREALPEIGSSLGMKCLLAVDCSGYMEVSGQLATQLTIIVNELALNAFKHGYDGREGGLISLALSSDGEKRVNLTFADSGDGLPDGFDPESGDGLGLRIVTSLVKSLGGSLSCRTDGGAHFTISVPAD